MNNKNQADFTWEHPEFAFYLPGEWRHVSTEDESRLELYSDQSETRITLSIEPLVIPSQDHIDWANRLLTLRRKAHEDWLLLPENMGRNLEISITDEKVSPLDGLDSIEVSYRGQYKKVSMFGFIGYVTTRKIVSMFCETKISFSPGRSQIFQTVANGFKNKLP
ncbi:hypothetical protein [Herbaspirillum lusitanum]|uniref:hypothetical protein n=1 Tax=Herbaspirillum lusitanum TaxID=213312 RepID=UPI00037A548E|nr:hypothetical protein [Herbaspirillum lusitanum]